MGILSDKKIDSHCHVLDPARFAYHPDVVYRPAGQEMGNAAADVLFGTVNPSGRLAVTLPRIENEVGGVCALSSPLSPLSPLRPG